MNTAKQFTHGLYLLIFDNEGIKIIEVLALMILAPAVVVSVIEWVFKFLGV